MRVHAAYRPPSTLRCTSLFHVSLPVFCPQTTLRAWDTHTIVNEEDMSGHGSVSHATSGVLASGVVDTSLISQLALGDANVHVDVNHQVDQYEFAIPQEYSQEEAMADLSGA